MWEKQAVITEKFICQRSCFYFIFFFVPHQKKRLFKTFSSSKSCPAMRDARSYPNVIKKSCFSNPSRRVAPKRPEIPLAKAEFKIRLLAQNCACCTSCLFICPSVRRRKFFWRKRKWGEIKILTHFFFRRVYEIMFFINHAPEQRLLMNYAAGKVFIEKSFGGAS